MKTPAHDDIDAAAAQLTRWRQDPVAFVRECLGAEPDAWQRDALAAFSGAERLALKACKGPGKTAVLAWCIWNFLLTRPYAKVAATSITEDNLTDNLWAELAKWHGGSPLLRNWFTWTKTRISCNEAPETWFATCDGPDVASQCRPAAAS